MSLGLAFVLLCALVSVTAAEDPRRCPEGFLEHGSSCYWFSNVKGSFAEARVNGEEDKILALCSDEAWKHSSQPRRCTWMERFLHGLHYGTNTDRRLIPGLLLSVALNNNRSSTGCSLFIRSRASEENGSPTYWLGATDLMKEGKFMWEGGCPLNYTNWSSGEPSNESHLQEKGEHCLSLLKYTDYKWNDRLCTSEINFICERKVSMCDCKN
ncbi:perlucin-like [Haliotis asinina]|uniref:perlucin-like n=1 Tax=Haliotis asinina TaxID=109174 RepID=UPI003531A4BE